MQVPVYDILNCGPRHRFVANGKLVHNSDKINLQNLPSRGPNAKTLKKTIRAPKGFVYIDCDSSQIEARMLAWLSGQEELLHTFATGGDPYKGIAASIYGKPESEINGAERFIGKATRLGAGYGMGAIRFREQVRTMGVALSPEESQHIIDVYRAESPEVTAYWKSSQHMLKQMIRGVAFDGYGANNPWTVDAVDKAIVLPNGLKMRYRDLHWEESEDGGREMIYMNRKKPVRIYGPKSVENLCQALARILVMEQMVLISKEFRTVLTVHDSVGSLVPERELDDALDYVTQCMRWTPGWADGLPVDCEASYGPTYGDQVEWEG